MPDNNKILVEIRRERFEICHVEVDADTAALYSTFPARLLNDIEDRPTDFKFTAIGNNIRTRLL